MKTAQELFEEWQKLMVAGKNWRRWDDLEQWEKDQWNEMYSKQIAVNATD